MAHKVSLGLQGRVGGHRCRRKPFYELAGKRKSGYDLSDPRKRNAGRPFWDRTTDRLRLLFPTRGNRFRNNKQKRAHGSFSDHSWLQLWWIVEPESLILSGRYWLDLVPLEWLVNVILVAPPIACISRRVIKGKKEMEKEEEQKGHARETKLMLTAVNKIEGDPDPTAIPPSNSQESSSVPSHDEEANIVSRFTSVTLIRSVHLCRRVASRERERASSRRHPIAGSVFWESLSDAFKCMLANKTSSPGEYGWW